MSVSFSIIVVTAGRDTLTRTLQSIAAQPLAPQDEVLVVGNGDWIREQADSFGYRYVEDGPFGCWGQRERQAAMFKARGTHLLFMDDDDYYLEGAIPAIRSLLEQDPTRPIMCRALHPRGLGTLWRSMELRCGNVSGTQFIVPNDDRLGIWGLRREGDFDFIQSTLRNYPLDSLVWSDLIIAGCVDQGIPAGRQPSVPAPRSLRVLLVHPGASWSTADVYDGLLYGLRSHGVHVDPYRLDTRIEASSRFVRSLWRAKRHETPDLPKPNTADVVYHAGVGVLEMALRQQVDVVLIVSGMLLHPDVIVLLKRAGLRVTVLFTESPYDHDQELRYAGMVDGCWTNERTVVDDFKRVNPNTGYLPHAWHPKKHYVAARQLGDLPTHDVVFVGSGFTERITWFNAIDWTGIDLGLYGTWDDLGLKPEVMACVRAKQITNEMTSALYRRARIGLNLYRRSKGWGAGVPMITHAESLSPRAYELAACGAFHLSEDRVEVHERFGDRVPTFSTPAEAEALIRRWLADPDGRARVAAGLPACVAGHSWVERAATVIGDLAQLVESRAA
jgi:spore maturation protein CgeB